MFRFLSPRLLWRWVSRSVGQKKTKKNEKKRKWTHEGVWVPEKAGLLNKKAWLSNPTFTLLDI